jgi:hypothetical protein
MRYLTLGEVVELHRLVLAASRASFSGSDLHPTLIEKTGGGRDHCGTSARSTLAASAARKQALARVH